MLARSASMMLKLEKWKRRDFVLFFHASAAVELQPVCGVCVCSRIRPRQRDEADEARRKIVFLLFDFFWKSRLWLHITFTEAARLDERWCSGHRKAVEMNNNLQQLEARESIWVDYSAAKQQTLAGMINVCAARRMTQIERLCLEWRHCERVSLLTSSMVCKKSS